MEPMLHRPALVVTISGTSTSARVPSTCTWRFSTCQRHIRLRWTGPLSSSLLRSTISRLIQTLCPHGHNPTWQGRWKGRSSRTKQTECWNPTSLHLATGLGPPLWSKCRNRTTNPDSASTIVGWTTSPRRMLITCTKWGTTLTPWQMLKYSHLSNTPQESDKGPWARKIQRTRRSQQTVVYTTERACNLSVCVGYYPLGLKVADVARLLRRCNHLLHERRTTRQRRSDGSAPPPRSRGNNELGNVHMTLRRSRVPWVHFPPRATARA